MKLDKLGQKENYIDWVRSITMNDNINIEAELDYTDSYKQTLAGQAKSSDAAGEMVSKEEKGGKKTFLWITGIAVVGGGATYLILHGKNNEKNGDIFPEPPDRPAN